MPTTASASAGDGAGRSSNQSGQGAKKNSYARVIGSATAGVCELLIFHPVDTVAKRLMSNQTVAIKGQPRADALSALNKVTFLYSEQTDCICCFGKALSSKTDCEMCFLVG